jgi:hypothetical protein
MMMRPSDLEILRRNWALNARIDVLLDPVQGDVANRPYSIASFLRRLHATDCIAMGIPVRA